MTLKASGTVHSREFPGLTGFRQFTRKLQRDTVPLMSRCSLADQVKPQGQELNGKPIMLMS